MSGWWNRRTVAARLLVYAVVVILAFVVAASEGAVAALVVSGDLAGPEEKGPNQEGTALQVSKAILPRTNRQTLMADNKDILLGRSERVPSENKPRLKREQPSYVSEVGEIQANSVVAFSDSHEKLLRYDTLTSGDIEEMQANQAAGLPASTCRFSCVAVGPKMRAWR